MTQKQLKKYLKKSRFQEISQNGSHVNMVAA